MNDQALGFILLAVAAIVWWADGRRQLRRELDERNFWRDFARRHIEQAP